MVFIVQGDGVGISEETLASNGKPGHRGPLGMRGRAGEIGATLTIESVNSGTRIEVRIPSRSAFRERGIGLLRRILPQDFWFRNYPSEGPFKRPTAARIPLSGNGKNMPE
jgi:hypothetical protein